MTQHVVIIDYGSGNLRSVQKAFERVANDCASEFSIEVTSDAADILQADRIVLPGVGAFAACKHGLDALPGMVDALTQSVLENQRPFLGICVGMQLLASRGFEYGECDGLGWIPGDVKKLIPNNPGLQIPHMGWNELDVVQSHSVANNIPKGSDAYFVHSYRFDTQNISDVIATCDYGGAFPAIVGRNNIIGVQFHPEKSQFVGLQFLRSFLTWDVT